MWSYCAPCSAMGSSLFSCLSPVERSGTPWPTPSPILPRGPLSQGHVQPQEAPVVSDHDALAPGMLCIHGITPHAAEHVCALPPPSPLPLVPEVLADIC